MPWGCRKSNDDSGHRNEYGKSKCPRCGKPVTLAGYARKSHLKACLRSRVFVNGKWHEPVTD